MRSNVVEKSEFGPGGTFGRLDAEFVDPLLLGAEQQVRTRPGSRLEKVVDANAQTGFDAPDDQDELVSYVSIDAVDTEDGLAFPDELRYADLPSRAKYRVVEGDVLVSNVRPNRGAVCLVGKRIAGALASSGFTLLRLPEGSKYSPELLFAMLKTDYARGQLVRRNRGSMYPAVVSDDVLDLWIPTPSADVRDSVRIAVGKALEWQERFYELHREMTVRLDQFLAKYGAPPSPLEGPVKGVDWTAVKSSRVFGDDGAARCDAEFFRSAYSAFDAHVLENGDSFLLGEHFELSPGRALGDGESEVPYIKQAVLTNVGVNWSAVAYEEGTPGPESGRVKEGDILLACTAHEIFYVGRKVDLVRSVPDEIRDNNTCVPDLMVIRPRDTKPKFIFASYVAAFLRHPAGRHQVQRCIRGLRGGHVYKDDLSKYVRVPIPSKKWLEEFEELADGMESARNKAKTIMNGSFDALGRFISKMSA